MTLASHWLGHKMEALNNLGEGGSAHKKTYRIGFIVFLKEWTFPQGHSHKQNPLVNRVVEFSYHENQVKE